MRVLLVHQAFVSPEEAGGTRHYEFARHMINAGHQFVIVASTLSYLSGARFVKNRRLVTRQEVDDIVILRAYTYPSLHNSFLGRIVAFISFMFTSIIAGLQAGEVDVVMGTSPPIFQAVSAWAIASIKRKPFLLEIRDLWPEFAVDMGVLRNPALIQMSRWLESFLYARAAHLLVNSPAYRDYLVQKGIPIEKISLIPNGVDPTLFSPNGQGEGVRQEFGLAEKYIVTYAGALGMANDIPMILRAAKRLQQRQTRIHILMVGDGKERPNLEAMAERSRLDNVTFTGSRPKSEMSSFLAASDACMATLINIPMFSTTYPNKVFDYMAAGRPTILAIDGVIREVVEDARGGIFVPPGDDAKLEEALLYLCEHPDEAKEMGRSARIYVSERFHRDAHAKQFIELLESLA